MMLTLNMLGKLPRYQVILAVGMVCIGIVLAIPATAGGVNAPDRPKPAPPPTDLLGELSQEMMGVSGLLDDPPLVAVEPQPSSPRSTTTRYLMGIENLLFGNNSQESYFLMPQMRIIEPKLRVYFDSGEDDSGEIDAFDDGALVPTLNLVEIRWVRHAGDGPNQTMAQRAASNHSPWSWGIAFGAGIGMPAQDSADGLTQASDAPVVLLTLGMFFEYETTKLDQETRELIAEALASSKSNLTTRDLVPTIGLEVGYAMAFSADEGLDDPNDGAWYFGLIFHVPF